MKKVLVIGSLLFVLSFSLIGCGGSATANNSSSGSSGSPINNQPTNSNNNNPCGPDGVVIQRPDGTLACG